MTKQERQQRRQAGYAASEGQKCIFNLRRLHYAIEKHDDDTAVLCGRLAEAYAQSAMRFARQALAMNAEDRAWLAEMTAPPPGVNAADRAFMPPEAIDFHAHEGTCRYCGHVVKMSRHHRTFELEFDNCHCVFCAQPYVVTTTDKDAWEHRQWLEKLVDMSQDDHDYC